MRLTKKALLLLRLTEKYSFTLSKLRFFGLRKPKNSSFYPTSLRTWVTHFTFGSPTSLFLPLRACCLPLNPAQCLLQQGTQVVIALLSLLVQFHKKIGSGLQCLVNGAGVLAVDCQFFEPLYKAVKE